MNIAALRREYQHATLDEKEVAADPYVQFDRWLNEAIQAEVLEPTAMTLSTVGAEQRPSSRVVLLKGFDANGLVFYTHYRSRKGRELAHNPWASVLFFWKELERQVRIEGRVEQGNAQEADQYFASRPLGSRWGAVVSPQSEVIPDRRWLENKLTEVSARHHEHVPRPQHWGGYRFIPDCFEFWQGRLDRLHDRMRYRLEQAHWNIERLAP